MRPRFSSWLLAWGPDVFWVSLFGLSISLAQLALFWQPMAGAYLNTAALLLAMAVALRSERLRSTAIAVAILPLAMMVSLSLPQSSAFAQLMVYYDALLLLALTYRFIFTLGQPLHHVSLGKKGYLAAVPTIIVTSQVIGIVSFIGIGHHNPLASVPLSVAILCCVVFAFAEEMFFRGLLQQRAQRTLHPVSAATLTTALYSAVNIGIGTPFAPMVAAINGGILSAVYAKKSNILVTCSINMAGKLAYLGLFALFIGH